MSLAEVFDTLGQTVIPAIADAVFPDTMNIKAESQETIGNGGERIKGSVTNAYTNVPCVYEPVARERSSRNVVGDKATPAMRYTLKFPTHQNGARIDIDARTHRPVVNARGNEPQKTFRFIGQPRDKSGVIFEADCVFEG